MTTVKYTDLGDGIQHIALRDVLFVPDLEKNLLSVRAMTKLGALGAMTSTLKDINAE